MRQAKPIVVIGSINMDLVSRVERLPGPGETIPGSDLIFVQGGKGANQSVAAARLCGKGRKVFHVGCVGDDDHGTLLLKGLKENGVDCRFVRRVKNVSSGAAIILLQKGGENSIVVALGANGYVSPRDVDAAKEVIAQAFAVVMQLEIPVATVKYAIRLCWKLNVMTILDPAPVPPRGLARELMGADLLTPNEAEARRIDGEAKSLSE